MKRLVIAIDCDDVLIPTAPEIIKAYNHEYGTTLDVADFYSRDPSKWGVDDIAQASARVGKYLLSDAHAAIAPTDEAVRAVSHLAKHHELHLVTGRSRALRQLTVAMVEKYFSDCFASIELTDFYDDAHRRTKGDVCQSIGADILVDDHLEHIESVLAVGMKEVIVFGEYPWNQSSTMPQGAKRCKDWVEVTAEVDKLAAR